VKRGFLKASIRHSSTLRNRTQSVMRMNRRIRLRRLLVTSAALGLQASGASENAFEIEDKATDGGTLTEFHRQMASEPVAVDLPHLCTINR
jgi:hypothetical protein